MVSVSLDRRYAVNGVIYNLKVHRDYGTVTKKAVAKLMKDGRLLKLVDKDEHYFRKYEGYAIADVLLEEIEGECSTIVIKERNNDKHSRTLVAPFETWKEKGIGHKSEGYESQVVLSEDEMHITEVE